MDYHINKVTSSDCYAQIVNVRACVHVCVRVRVRARANMNKIYG